MTKTIITGPAMIPEIEPDCAWLPEWARIPHCCGNLSSRMGVTVQLLTNGPVTGISLADGQPVHARGWVPVCPQHVMEMDPDTTDDRRGGLCPDCRTMLPSRGPCGVCHAAMYGHSLADAAACAAMHERVCGFAGCPAGAKQTGFMAASGHSNTRHYTCERGHTWSEFG